MSVSKKINYEVNIIVPTNLQSPFIKWLGEHIAEMEELDGIEKETRVFENLYLEDEGQLSLSVHYQFESLGSLDNYLKNEAENMRGKLPEPWRNQLKFSRRILKKFEPEL